MGRWGGGGEAWEGRKGRGGVGTGKGNGPASAAAHSDPAQTLPPPPSIPCHTHFPPGVERVDLARLRRHFMTATLLPTLQQRLPSVRRHWQAMHVG